MQSDMSKVPFTDEELSAVQNVTVVTDEVVKQAGPEDEEPGIDADDVGEILLKAFAPGTATYNYLVAATTPNELFRRIKNIGYGVERAYDPLGPAT